MLTMKRMLIAKAKAQSFKSFNVEISSTGPVAAFRNATCTTPCLYMVSLVQQSSYNPLDELAEELDTVEVAKIEEFADETFG
jgi:hypothetical protein